MIETLKYVNHLGDVFEFGKNGVYANENDLRNYSWKYDEKRNRVENFRRSVTQKSIPVILFANTEAEGMEIKNRMFKTFEKDVIAGKKGRIWIGDYFMECFITESRKSGYTNSKKEMNVSLKIVSDKGTWIKEVPFQYLWETEYEDMLGKGYEYGYEHDYTNVSGHESMIQNNHFCESDFVLRIFGYAENPEIAIGKNIYKLNLTVNEGEFLTLNTVEKSIILTKTDDIEVNVFSKRDRSHYIFNKIATDVSKIYWNGNFDFDIILLTERSEPEWI